MDEKAFYDYLHSLFTYDQVTGKLIWKRNKGRGIAGTEAGSVNGRGYKIMRLRPYGTFPLHRLIYLMQTGEMPREIDHVNGNHLDNRWLNLRECSHKENMHNQRIHSHNTSGVTGVGWHKRIEKWQAYTIHEGKQTNIGYFDDFDEAIKAREVAVAKYWYGVEQVSDIVSSAAKVAAAPEGDTALAPPCEDNVGKV